ncbi:MAG: nicotinate (nicotinamide) nucleotide adenylyltransferase [Chloroflexi bacterium]|nr:nicotinate (nicotinamide) nucleotide adenylyltransferase [Chloroflexota bacterium]|tara:strand:+ start:3301 stop:3900 length:600 start_codon:yes stop_codon:yes gene_type:complete
MALKNLGIFGGSFDPIHNGHIKISLLAQKQLHLDILLFIPVYDQWMKNSGPYATSIDRLDMINVSISNLSNIQTCDIDIKREKHTYTIDTLSDLIKLYPKVENIYLIVGEDSINKMDKWYKSEEIKKICTIAVYKRENKKFLVKKSKNDFYKNIVNIAGPRIDISSTKIREYIDKNLSIENLVPRQVEEIIIKRGLYKR